MTLTEFERLEERRSKEITSNVYRVEDGPLHALSIDQTGDGLFLPHDAEWIAACSLLVPKLIAALNIAMDARSDAEAYLLQEQIEELGL